MMNEEEVNALKVVFKYSDVNLEEIELPEDLHLEGIVTKI
jgi:myosin-5